MAERSSDLSKHYAGVDPDDGDESANAIPSFDPLFTHNLCPPLCAGGASGRGAWTAFAPHLIARIALHDLCQNRCHAL